MEEEGGGWCCEAVFELGVVVSLEFGWLGGWLLLFVDVVLDAVFEFEFEDGGGGGGGAALAKRSAT